MNQRHSIDAGGSPPVGWYVDQRNGYWSLTIHQQSSPDVYLKTFSIFDVPLDVKVQIRWSTSDAVEFIRLWLNGVPQTFKNGTDTYYMRTLDPSMSGVYDKERMYRGQTATDIDHHTGFRGATDESGLQYGPVSRLLAWGTPRASSLTTNMLCCIGTRTGSS